MRKMSRRIGSARACAMASTTRHVTNLLLFVKQPWHPPSLCRGLTDHGDRRLLGWDDMSGRRWLSVLLLGSISCRLDARPSGDLLVQRPTPMAAELATASAAGEPSEPMPRPYRGRLGGAVALNVTCVSCHAPEAEEWRASRHREAYSNAAFQEALRIEPMA